MRIIKKPDQDKMTVEDLDGKELIAYRCLTVTDNPYEVAVLSQISHGNFGFIPLNHSDSKPRYVGSSWYDAIKKAHQNRQLHIFDSMDELMTATLKRRI